VSVNETLIEDKCVDSRLNVHILSSTRDPFTLTTVQVPNLALTHTKRITVYEGEGWEIACTQPRFGLLQCAAPQSPPPLRTPPPLAAQRGRVLENTVLRAH
jgi:hypothetical protein